MKVGKNMNYKLLPAKEIRGNIKFKDGKIIYSTEGLDDIWKETIEVYPLWVKVFDEDIKMLDKAKYYLLKYPMDDYTNIVMKINSNGYVWDKENKGWVRISLLMYEDGRSDLYHEWEEVTIEKVKDLL